jgi:flagellar hook-basal body complex protein FliE
MNSIDAIRQLYPDLTATPMGPAQQGASPVSIPAAELRELNASQLGGVAAPAPATSSFSSLLSGMVQDVNAKQNAAGQALHDLQTGQNVSLHQVMIANEEASVSFQLMVEVRNRLLDAYQEVMRTQV